MPELERVRSALGDARIGFLALSIEPDAALVHAAAARLGLDMPVAVTDREVLAPLGVRAVPSVVFVSAEGLVVAAASGERGRRFLEARARDLLR